MSPSDGCARCTPVHNWQSNLLKLKGHRNGRNYKSKGHGRRSDGLDRHGHEFMIRKSGFEEGWIAESIVGAKDCQHGIFYLVKWKDREDVELIPAFVTFNHVPSLVIHFYANRLGWIASALSTPDPG